VQDENDKKYKKAVIHPSSSFPRAERVTRWEGETTEQKRHKEMLRKIEKWEEENK